MKIDVKLDFWGKGAYRKLREIVLGMDERVDDCDAATLHRDTARAEALAGLDTTIQLHPARIEGVG